LAPRVSDAKSRVPVRAALARRFAAATGGLPRVFLDAMIRAGRVAIGPDGRHHVPLVVGLSFGPAPIHRHEHDEEHED